MAQNPKVAKLVMEFVDVFPNELPKGFPPIHGLENQIDLISGAPPSK